MTKTYATMFDAFHATRPRGAKLYFNESKHLYSWSPRRGFRLIKYQDLLCITVSVTDYLAAKGTIV